MEPNTVVAPSPLERDYLRNYVSALLRSETFSRITRETERPIGESSVALNARHKLMQLGAIKIPGVDSRLPEKLFPLVPGVKFTHLMQEELGKPHSLVLGDLRPEEKKLIAQSSVDDILIQVAEKIILSAFGTKTTMPTSRLAEKCGTTPASIVDFIATRPETFKQCGDLISLPQQEHNLATETLPPLPTPRNKRNTSPVIDQKLLERTCEFIIQTLRVGHADHKTGINHIAYKELQKTQDWLLPFQDLKGACRRGSASAAFGIKVGTNYKNQSVLLLANAS
jgi:hypothetical protein